MSQPAEKIECVLCKKSYPVHKGYGSGGKITGWSKVCDGCVHLWELGKKREQAAKADGKLVYARVLHDVPLEGRHGDPEAEPIIRGVDIIAAMGATKLRGTEKGGRWSGDSKDIRLVDFNEEKAIAYHPGGKDRVEVPQARAEAMRRILLAVLDALAKARVAGFNQGRDLIAGLADGSLHVDDYSKQSDNARAGKQPRGRFD